MGKKPKDRVSLGNEEGLIHNPFAALAGRSVSSSLGSTGGDMPHQATGDGSADRPAAAEPDRDSGPSSKVEVRRERKGRGGKVVTLVTWLAGEPPEPLPDYCKVLARGLGTGARVDEGRIVIQGDLAQRVRSFLQDTPGTTVVLATQ